MKFRNRSNFIAGWVLGYGLQGAFFAWDPLALFFTPTADWGEISFDSVMTTVISGLFTNVCFMFFAKPYVELQSSALVVQNPLKVWTLDRSHADLVRDGYPYPYVQVGQKRIRLISMERSFGSLLMGYNVADRIPDITPVDTSAATRPLEGRFNVTGSQAVLIGAWVIYVGLALLFS